MYHSVVFLFGLLFAFAAVTCQGNLLPGCESGVLSSFIALPSPAFSARRTASLAQDPSDPLVAYLFGGYGGINGSGNGSPLADLWQTKDGGITWNLIQSAAPTGPRFGAVVQFLRVILPNQAADVNASMLVIGGYTSSGDQNDIWVVTDEGNTWNRHPITPNAPFAVRESPYTWTVGNTLYVAGGYSNGPALNDVWSSSDGGSSWRQLTSAAQFSPRYAGCAFFINGQHVIIGGKLSFVTGAALSEIWASWDGVNWRLVNSNPGWAPRTSVECAVVGDSLYVIGGLNSNNAYDDVWSTPLKNVVSNTPWQLLYGGNSLKSSGFPPSGNGVSLTYYGRLLKISGYIIPQSINSNAIYVADLLQGV